MKSEAAREEMWAVTLWNGYVGRELSESIHQLEGKVNNWRTGPYKAKMFLHSEGNHQPSEAEVHGVGALHLTQTAWF